MFGWPALIMDKAPEPPGPACPEHLFCTTQDPDGSRKCGELGCGWSWKSADTHAEWIAMNREFD